MAPVLTQTWKLTTRCSKWWGVMLLVLLFISAVMLMSGILTLNINLDLGFINDLTNPMLALMLFALLLFLAFYPLCFIILLPITFLISLK